MLSVNNLEKLVENMANIQCFIYKYTKYIFYVIKYLKVNKILCCIMILFNKCMTKDKENICDKF